MVRNPQLGAALQPGTKRRIPFGNRKRLPGGHYVENDPTFLSGLLFREITNRHARQDIIKDRNVLAPAELSFSIEEVLSYFRILVPLLAGPFLVSSCAKTPALSASERPKNWSQPVSLAGVPNLYRVSDELYRSGQPTAEGMRELEKRGIRTVVSFRAFSDDRDELAGTTLQSRRIPIYTWDPGPKDDDKFFQALEESPKPVLIHCLHGSDRTGAMVALYRIREQGWSVEEAVAEMQSGGTGFHRIWHHLPEWVAREAGKPLLGDDAEF